MPKFVIVRDIPGAGGMTADDLMAASQKSCSVLNKLGAEIQWIHPYVTDDKIYCIYTAPNSPIKTSLKNMPVRAAFPQAGFPKFVQ